MLRVFTALYVLLTIFAASAHAEKYNDPYGRFSVTVPPGWAAEKPNSNVNAGAPAEITLFMVGIREKKMVGLCLALLANTPDTRSMSQAEIDSKASSELTEDAWRASAKSSGFGDKIAIESSGNRQGPGHLVHYVVTTMDSKNKDGTVTKMKGKQELHMLPGVIHMVGCATDAESYDTASVDFETIFTSFTPMAGVVAQTPQPVGPSVVTLFSGADFTGVARVLTQDAPSVAALGLSGPTGSVAISGFGAWQACEGANYTGTCRALRAAETGAPGRTLKFGSLRRLPPSAAGLAGVVNLMAGRALRETKARFEAR